MKPIIFITGNNRKSEAYDFLPRFIDWICKKDIPVYVDEIYRENLNIDPERFCSFDDALAIPVEMILTFGGDGTILYTASLVGNHRIPLLGFNLGGLGFLADLTLDECTKALEYILHDEFHYDERNMLIIDDGRTEKTAVNDVVFDKAGFHRVIEIQTWLEDDFINGYIADGLIISTPTGSTGYNLSSGGPIIMPGTDVIALSPICPHSLTARPLIIPAAKKLKIRVLTESDHFICNTDGRILGTYSSGHEFTIRKADYPLRLIKFPEKTIFTILRDKLRWGIDFRNKNRWSYDSN